MFQSNFWLVETFQGIIINKLQIFKLLSLQINPQELKQRKSIKKFEFFFSPDFSCSHACHCLNNNGERDLFKIDH